MAVQVFKNEFSALPAATMAAWAKIPPAIAGDCMNRQNVMAGRISPVAAGMRFVGQARTIASVAGDSRRTGREHASGCSRPARMQ